MSAAPHGRDIGVVIALPREAASWQAGRIRRGQSAQCGRYRLTISGPGLPRARQAALQLRDAGVGALVSWGVAAGLSASLQPGQLIVADGMHAAGGHEPVDPAWCQHLLTRLRDAGLAVHSGPIWSQGQAVGSVAAKQQLARRGCLAADMEGHAVAHVAREGGLPFIAVKSICDPFDRPLPDAVVQLLDGDGRVRPLALLRLLARGPRAWRSLRGLQQDMHAACHSLRQAASAWQQP